MTSDPAIGPWLREIRRSRGLTLDTLARRVGCAESLLSLVERGKRPLQPWLVRRLEREFDLGGALTSAVRDPARQGRGANESIAPLNDAFVLEHPRSEAALRLSRRGLLAALAIGSVSGPARQSLQLLLDDSGTSTETISSLHETFRTLAAAARVLHPAGTVDPILGHIALVDVLRQRSNERHALELLRLQTRYAELLSWLHEELGDVAHAGYWIDRTSQWAHQSGWTAMVAYTHVRRSMVALSHFDDPGHAIELTQMSLATPGASDRVLGLAAKQLAFAHALAGHASDSERALDVALRHLSLDAAADGCTSTDVGQRSVVDDDLLAVFRATCDVYQGRPDEALTILQPRLPALDAASSRTAVITSAKVVHALARAGAVDGATVLMTDTLARVRSVGSASARRELQRAAPALARWHHRPDVRDVVRELSSPP